MALKEGEKKPVQEPAIQQVVKPGDAAVPLPMDKLGGDASSGGNFFIPKPLADAEEAGAIKWAIRRAMLHYQDSVLDAVETRLKFLSGLGDCRSGVSLWIAAGDTLPEKGDTPLFLADALFGIPTIATNVSPDVKALKRVRRHDDKWIITTGLFIRRAELSGVRWMGAIPKEVVEKSVDWLDERLKLDVLDVKDLGRFIAGRNLAGRIRHISCLNLFNSTLGFGMDQGVDHDEVKNEKQHIRTMLNNLPSGGTFTYSTDMIPAVEAVCRKGSFTLKEHIPLGAVGPTSAFMSVLEKKIVKPVPPVPR